MLGLACDDCWDLLWTRARYHFDLLCVSDCTWSV